MTSIGYESLLSGSNILLYGRILRDITLDHEMYDRATVPRKSGKNKLIHESLYLGNDSRLARIYGFSYQGKYFELGIPAIFLVHGGGEEPEGPRPSDSTPPRSFVSEGASDYDKVGVALQRGHFAQDIRVWSYDKSDFSLRLDMSSGMLEQILLNVELSDGSDYPQFGGGKVGGGKVGGGKVGGGKVGGGKIGGGEWS